MNSRIRETFDGIRAEEDLKNRTKQFLARRTNHYRRPAFLLRKGLAPVLVCVSLIMICMAGYRIYFTPTSVISIDINPSMELNINRFDRVISVVPYNDDGKLLAAAADVRFLDYRDALDRILDNENVIELLSQDEILSVVVVEADERQREEMLSNIATCTSGHGNVFCYSAHHEEVEEAHGHGLSYGKYCALLELQRFDPDITAEDIQGMTMSEIRNLLRELSGGSYSFLQDENCMEQEHHDGSAGYDGWNGYGHHPENGHHGNRYN